MTNVAFKLQDSGFTREQVEALTEFMTGSVATKEDVTHLDGKIDTNTASLNAKIDANTASLNAKIDANTASLHRKIDANTESLRSEMNNMKTELKWIKAVGATILTVLILPWLAKFVAVAMP